MKIFDRTDPEIPEPTTIGWIVLFVVRWILFPLAVLLVLWWLGFMG
jgi:hypothetical protein